jgi:hypothetical protein
LSQIDELRKALKPLTVSRNDFSMRAVYVLKKSLMTQGVFLADPSLIDPSLAEGEKIIFEKEIRMLTHVSEEEDVTECVQFRTLVQEEDDSFLQVRFEIFTDADLFFFFESAYAPEDFATMGHDSMSFTTFPNHVIELLERSIADPNDIHLTFTRVTNGRALFKFEQPVKFRSKRIELLVLEFGTLSDELLRQQIQYRFRSAIANLKVATTQLGDLYALLKVKSPGVLSPTKSNSK